MKASSTSHADEDLRSAPAYGIPEAAHYLRLPARTLRDWVRGRTYETSTGPQSSAPVISLADPKACLLSFVNLVEAHVLAAIRRQHEISFPKIRQTLSYLEGQFPSEHPLADLQFAVSGYKLFIEHLGQLIGVPEGQLSMIEVMEQHLERIKRDPSGLALKLYLFTRKNGSLDAPRIVEVDPRIAFGRPILSGTRIPTEVVHQRFTAGESIVDLAEDYDRRAEEIEEAIRCEDYRAAA